jgi:hypothetical protein
MIKPCEITEKKRKPVVWFPFFFYTIFIYLIKTEEMITDISDTCICKNCEYCEGRDEYEEGRFGIFCSHPDISDYLEGEPKICSLKIDR